VFSLAQFCDVPIYPTTQEGIIPRKAWQNLVINNIWLYTKFGYESKQI
jgi:hypothetical protein